MHFNKDMIHEWNWNMTPGRYPTRYPWIYSYYMIDTYYSTFNFPFYVTVDNSLSTTHTLQEDPLLALLGI